MYIMIAVCRRRNISETSQAQNNYLLSDNLWFMIRFAFKRTVICPEIDAVRDAGDASLIDLSD